MPSFRSVARASTKAMKSASGSPCTSATAGFAVGTVATVRCWRRLAQLQLMHRAVPIGAVKSTVDVQHGVAGYLSSASRTLRPSSCPRATGSSRVASWRPYRRAHHGLMPANRIVDAPPISVGVGMELARRLAGLFGFEVLQRIGALHRDLPRKGRGKFDAITGPCVCLANSISGR